MFTRHLIRVKFPNVDEILILILYLKIFNLICDTSATDTLRTVSKLDYSSFNINKFLSKIIVLVHFNRDIIRKNPGTGADTWHIDALAHWRTDAMTLDRDPGLEICFSPILERNLLCWSSWNEATKRRQIKVKLVSQKFVGHCKIHRKKNSLKTFYWAT